MCASFGIKKGNCRVIVDVQSQDIRGEGSEFPRIIIPLKIAGETSKTEIHYTLMTIQGEIIVRGDSKHFTIGKFSENATLKIESARGERSVILSIPINFWALEKIEQIRKEDLSLTLDCNFNYLLWDKRYNRADFSTTDNQSIRFTIPQSNWLKILKNTGFTNIKILEIVIPEAFSDEKFDIMVKHLKVANDFILKGDYESAVKECRLAIEPIPNLLPTEKITNKDGKPPSFKDRLNQFCKEHIQSSIGKEKTKMLVKTIWSFSSQFHHSDTPKKTKKTDISRTDAEFIIHTTSGIIAYLGKILSQ